MKEQVEIQGVLEKEIEEYRSGQITPELINGIWRTIWTIKGDKISHKFIVPTCDRTTDELTQLHRENRAVLLLPDEIYAKNGLRLIRGTFQFPPDRLGPRDDYYYVNEDEKGGCIDIEMGIGLANAPREWGMNESMARGLLESMGRKGQRYATYVVGSEWNRLLNGHSFDETTSSRLLGTGWVRGDTKCSSLVESYDSSKGFMNSYWEGSGKLSDLSVGFRSEGRRKI